MGLSGFGPDSVLGWKIGVKEVIVLGEEFVRGGRYRFVGDSESNCW